MLRKLSAIALGVSFIALSTSGLMMFFIEQPSFTIQMHPVHKLFGLIMVLSAIIHISFNYKVLLQYLKQKSAMLFAGTMVALLVVLYGVASQNQVPEELAKTMDEAAQQAEHK